MNTNAISHEVEAGPRLSASRILAAMLLGLLWGLPAKAAGAESPAAAGITEPFLDVVLSAPVPGIITVEKFKEGDLVKEGEVVLELDKKLEQLETERRKVVRDQRRSDFEGTQRVFTKTPGVSKEELDKKEVEYKVAAVEYDMAMEQLRRRQLISPLSGAITEILLDVGESCQAYQPLVRVVETRRCYFVTNVDAKAAVGLKLGQTMKLEIEEGSKAVSVSGTIDFLSPVVDPASGLQKVKLIFDNADGKIRPGVAGKLILP